MSNETFKLKKDPLNFWSSNMKEKLKISKNNVNWAFNKKITIFPQLKVWKQEFRKTMREKLSNLKKPTKKSSKEIKLALCWQRKKNKV
jgi:hypothetical protein